MSVGVENAGDYRVKGYSKEQYDQLLAEQAYAGKLDEPALRDWTVGANIAYTAEYARMTPKAGAARAYAYCATH